MSTGKVVLGVAAGAAVGALMGVLYAPARGAVTRRTMYRRGEQEVDALKEKFNDFVDTISDNFAKMKNEVEDVTDEAMMKADSAGKEIKDKAKEKFENGKEKFENIKDQFGKDKTENQFEKRS